MNKVRYGNLPGPGDLYEEEENLPKPQPDYEEWEVEDHNVVCDYGDKWSSADFEYDPLSRKGFE